MLMMSFDDALTRANFSFVYFLQFYLLKFFDIFQWGGLNPPNPPLATPLTEIVPGEPLRRAIKPKRGSDFGHIEGYISETVQDGR